MFFTAHKPQLESVLASCQRDPSMDTVQTLLCAGLRSLLRHCALYDACIMPDNPFLSELGEYLSHFDADDRFSVLECLIIVLREKKLRQHDCCDEEEGRVLQYFEQSGEWAPDDGTLVSLWYWIQLPLACGKA